jgi:iron complex outermembrane receptor protein
MLVLVASSGDGAAGAPLRTDEVRVEDARLGEDAAAPPPEPSAFVTVIDARAAGAGAASLPEVLARAASVQVRSQGGLGAFTAVTMRGSTAAQVAVFLDGVPLNRDSTGAPDLSQVPLDALERIEVYRGGVPAELGGAALGGAINLVTRRPGTRPELELKAGYGSFGTRQASVRAAGARGPLAGSLYLGYRGSRGDFPFYDDNQTEFTTSDDRTRRRANNGYDELDGAFTARWRRGDAEAIASGQTLYKDQGIPPFRSLLADGVRLTTARQTLDVALARRRLREGALDLGGSAFLLAQWQHFVNPGGVGVGRQDATYTSGGGGLRGRAGLAVGAHQLFVLVPEVRGELFDTESLIPGQPPAPGGRRVAAGVALRDEIALAADRLLLTPALRFDLVRTWSPTVAGAHLESYFSPRLGVRGELQPQVLALKANAGLYYRPPTFFELFGSPGLMLPAAGLVGEHGLSADLGAVLTTARLTAEVAGFVRRVQDLIAYERRLLLLQAANDPRVRVVPGIELAVQARPHRAVALSGHYAYTAADLPGQPRHQALGRVELERPRGRVRPAAFYEADLASSDYLDLGRERLMPGRLLHAAGVRLSLRGVRALGGDARLTLEGRNLADVRTGTVALAPATSGLTQTPVAIADFFGYPLPGRSLFATLEWRY